MKRQKLLTFAKFRLWKTNEEIIKATSLMAKEINQKFSGKRVALVVNYYGTIPLLYELRKRLKIKDLVTIAVRIKSYHGTEAGQPEIVSGLEDYDLTGYHIIIVEDIVDSGVTAKMLIQMAKDKNPAGVFFATLVDKPQCHKNVDLQIDYVCFIYRGNKFLVGFGFDYNNQYRTEHHIRLMPRPRN